MQTTAPVSNVTGPNPPTASPQPGIPTTIGDLPARWEFITMTPSQLQDRMQRTVQKDVIPNVQASPLIAGSFVLVVMAYLCFCIYQPLGDSDTIQNWASLFVIGIMIVLALFDTSISRYGVSPTLRMIIGLVAGSGLVAAARS